MAWLFTVLLGCGILSLIPDDPEPSCDHRAWYPDEDGDGVGEPTSMYVGCTPPSGYVDVVDTDVAADTDVTDTDTDVTDTDTDTAADTDTDTL